MTARPAFVTFTGVDRLSLVEGMAALSARYPIEWGVLVDDSQPGDPLFPDAAIRAALLRTGGLRWAAHVCGAAARAVADEGDAAIDLAGFERVQINHGEAGSTPAQIRNAAAFGRRLGIRSILQCRGDFPAEPSVDWLHDVSFGRGVTPATRPTPPLAGPFCGYSGGLGPATIEAFLASAPVLPDAVYWIDMEAGIRTDGWLDLAKCEAVCRAVFGGIPGDVVRCG